MAFPNSNIDDSYWLELTIGKNDIEFLYNFLFEKEIPLKTESLVRALINYRINLEINAEKAKQTQRGTVYLPKETHHIGQDLIFPSYNWNKGTVNAVREGNNLEIAPFSVIDVEFEDGSLHSFASELEVHSLNEPAIVTASDSSLNEEEIFSKFGEHIIHKLGEKLKGLKDLVLIGEEWFPKSLLFDFNQGHLNIIEAVLDMQAGGPMSPKELLKQIDVEVAEDQSLIEFSLNYTLQQDPRFDEVGTEGVYSWFLHRLEPEPVREVPVYLQHTPSNLELPEVSNAVLQMLETIDDELIKTPLDYLSNALETSFVLNYPHWRVGSIPLSPKTSQIFPSALETDRVKITIHDTDTDQDISAWVVRPYKYVFGLRKWYEDRELIPGSVIYLEKSDKPGKVFIRVQKKRSNREWIRTVLVGKDGGIVIALLKQPITGGFQERLAIAIPDVQAIDEVWKVKATQPKSLKSDVVKMMTELSKLNSQRHVHFLELYAAINIIRRSPPEPILSLLISDPEFVHVGDQYYHLKDAG